MYTTKWFVDTEKLGFYFAGSKAFNSKADAERYVAYVKPMCSTGTKYIIVCSSVPK